MARGEIDRQVENLCHNWIMVSFRQQLFVVIYTLAITALPVALWFRPQVKDWPAWVQAVGSIAAILAAIGIAQWQAGRERRDRMDDRRELRKAVAGLARRLADVIADHADTLITNPEYAVYEGIDWSDLNLLDAAIDRFDPSALVSADGVFALESLRREARLMAHWEKVVADELRQAAFHDFDINDALRAWRDRAEGFAVVLEKLAED